MLKLSLYAVPLLQAMSEENCFNKIYVLQKLMHFLSETVVN